MGTDGTEFRAFYDALGERYDRMTCDAERWGKLEDDYRQLFSEIHPHSILDAGCGTGGEALLLSGLGFNVIGVDGSAILIERARTKAARQGVDVDFRQDDLRLLSTVIPDSINAVICRGNTLPHLLTLDDLKAALNAFKRVLKSGGLLVLSWLNYKPVISENRRLVGVNGDAGEMFIRFYDFLGAQSLNFNIIALQRDDKWKSNWISTRLTAWMADDVGILLKADGWRSLEIAADLTRAAFDPDVSRDVVLFAVRP